jgi:hypothetical protein
MPAMTTSGQLRLNLERFGTPNIASLLFEHDLFRKPVSTFRDHAVCLSMIFSDLPSPAEAENEGSSSC